MSTTYTAEEERELAEAFSIVGKGKKADGNALRQLLEELNKTDALPADFDAKKYQEAGKIPKRIALINVMVKTIEKSLNRNIGNRAGTKFALRNSFTTDSFKAEFPLKVSIMETGDGNGQQQQIVINLKAHDLLNLPPEALYTAIIAAVYKKVSKGRTNEINLDETTHSEDYAFYKDNREETKKQEKEAKFQSDLAKAKKLISSYLEGFLADFYGEEFTDFRAIAKWVTSEIVEGLDQKGLDALMMDMFSGKIDDLARENVDIFLQSSDAAYNLKVSSLASKAEKLPPEDLRYDKQLSALLNQRTKSAFVDMTNGGKNNRKQIEDFCKEYVYSFKGHNVTNITFNNTGSLGEYDSVKNSININLSKIAGKESWVSELVMTLSHELTHAVDNSQLGGLANDISSDIPESAESKLSPDAYSLLRKINFYSYHLNPNERRARVGELSALGFMRNLAGGKYENELMGSIGKYNAYQQRTIEMAKAVKGEASSVESLQELWNQYRAIESSIPAEFKSEFTSRLKYLDALKESYEKGDKFALDTTMEEESKVAASAVAQERIQEAINEAKKMKEEEEARKAAGAIQMQ